MPPVPPPRTPGDQPRPCTAHHVWLPACAACTAWHRWAERRRVEAGGL